MDLHIFCILVSFASPIYTLFRQFLWQNGNKMVTKISIFTKMVTKIGNKHIQLWQN